MIWAPRSRPVENELVDPDGPEPPHHVREVLGRLPRRQRREANDRVPDLPRVATEPGGEVVEPRTALRRDPVEVVLGHHFVATERAPPIGVLRCDPQHLRAVRSNCDGWSWTLDRQRDGLCLLAPVVLPVVRRDLL